MSVVEKKLKKVSTKADESVRTTISLHEKVHKWALELADQRGFGKNFSAYISDLVRRDWEKQTVQHAGSFRTQTSISGGASDVDMGVAIAPTADEAASTMLKRQGKRKG